MWNIYKIYVNETEEVIYVGQTTMPEGRWFQHFKKKPGNHGHGYFYGREEELTMQVIEEGIPTKTRALVREEYWQEHYGLPSDKKKMVERGKHVGKNNMTYKTFEERSEASKKAAQTRKEKYGESYVAHKAHEKLNANPVAKQAWKDKIAASLTGQKSNLTEEQKKAKAAKAWETRRLRGNTSTKRKDKR